MHHVLTSFVWRCNIKETSAFFTWKRWEIGHFIGTQWLYIHYCGMLISETGTSINSPAWDRESQVVNSLCVTKRKLWCGKKKNPCLMQSVKGFPLCVCAITSSLPLPPTCQKSLLPQAQLVAACWPNILWAFTANRPKACQQSGDRQILCTHFPRFTVGGRCSWLIWSWPSSHTL